MAAALFARRIATAVIAIRARSFGLRRSTCEKKKTHFSVSGARLPPIGFLTPRELARALHAMHGMLYDKTATRNKHLNPLTYAQGQTPTTMCSSLRKPG
eukprot:scaffold52385_cov34-Tisochrysis_lutea.AAC.4